MAKGLPRTAARQASKQAIASINAFTISTGGTPSDTLADVPAAYTEATLANQLNSLATKINAILAALKL